MNILAISNHGDIIGGGELSLIDLVSGLPQGYHPLVAVPSDGEVAERLRQRDVPVVVVPLPTIRPWRLPSMAATVTRIARIARRHRVSLIHANGSRAAFYGGLAGRWVRIPALFHCRIHQRDRWLDPILIRIVSGVVANSQATADRFGRFPSRSVTVVYNGIDLAAFTDALPELPAEQPDGDWVVTVARLSRGKRHDLVLKAFSDLAVRFPQAHLAIIGGPDPVAPEWADVLRRQADALACRDRIQWIGAVENLRPWLRRARLMVHAADAEAFGRVIVEAMAMGVPVAATASGGIPELIGSSDIGLLSPPGDADALFRNMTTVFANPHLAKRLAEAGRVRASQFTIERHVARMTTIFETTVGRMPVARGRS